MDMVSAIVRIEVVNAWPRVGPGNTSIAGLEHDQVLTRLTKNKVILLCGGQPTKGPLVPGRFLSIVAWSGDAARRGNPSLPIHDI
jgi:hypothetical protein